MKRWRLNTRAFHNNRIHEPGEIIELEDDVAPPSKAQFIPGKGQAIEDVPMAEEVTDAAPQAPAPIEPASPDKEAPLADVHDTGSVGAPPQPPVSEMTSSGVSDVFFAESVEPLVPRFEPGDPIPSAPEKEVVAEETPPRPL